MEKWVTLPLITLGAAAITGLLIWAAVALFTNAFKSDDRSLLEKPETAVQQSATGLAAADAASQQGRVHPDHRKIRASLHPLDKHNFQLHLANIAAQRGWYAHQFEQWGMTLLVPETDVETVMTIEDDPYSWLEQHQDEALPPVDPELGHLPYLVRVHTTKSRSGFTKAMGGVLATILALSAGAVCVIAAITLMEDIGVIRKKGVTTD